MIWVSRPPFLYVKWQEISVPGYTYMYKQKYISCRSLVERWIVITIIHYSHRRLSKDRSSEILSYEFHNFHLRESRSGVTITILLVVKINNVFSGDNARISYSIEGSNAVIIDPESGRVRLADKVLRSSAPSVSYIALNVFITFNILR